MPKVNGQVFPTTHWSLVALAGHAEQEARQAALEALLRRYLAPLRQHLRVRHGLSDHDADDLLQEFVAQKVLQQALLPRADRTRGRFRTFLLTTLDHFAVSRARHASAKKRSPGAAVQLLDPEEVAELHNGPAPDQAVLLAWARELIATVLDEMRRQCLAKRRADVWDVFDGRVLRPMLDGAAPVSYELLAQRNGLADAAAANNLLITAKRAFARLLRSAVGEYESDQSDVEQEIADLRAVLAGERRGGR